MLFWVIFCPLTLLTTQKIKVLKKWKKNLEILSFCTHVPQKIIIWCMVPKIFSATDRLFCHFGLFFALLPPNNLENQNFEKTKITPGDIIILHMNILNGNHMFDSWDMEHNRQNFFSFWTNSCLSTLLSSLLITQRIKILKKWKKRVSHTSVP